MRNNEYSTEDLTKRQRAFVHGLLEAQEVVECLIADYYAEDDASVMDKMRCEIAEEVLTEAKDRIESSAVEALVSFADKNACEVLDKLSRKKAEKKFGKRFVREVLDE